MVHSFRAESRSCSSLDSKSKTPMFWCWHCFIVFQNEASLTRHMQFHIGKPLKCFQCSMPFREKWELLQHSYVDSANHWFKCGMCFKAFEQRCRLEDHMNNHKKADTHQCPTCPKKFVWLPRLKKHMIAHMGLGPYACAPCRKGFKTKVELEEHHQANHKMNHGTHDKTRRKRRLSPYPEVPLSFGSPASPGGASPLRTYLSKRPKDTLTGLPEDSGSSSTFQCHLCPQDFVNAEVLRGHLYAHVEELPYKCSLCPRMFTTSTELNAHLSFHENNQDFVLQARRIKEEGERR